MHKYLKCSQRKNILHYLPPTWPNNVWLNTGSSTQYAKLGFFSTGLGAVGLNNLMQISLVLVNFPLARPIFHWPRAPGQLLRSPTGIMCLPCVNHLCCFSMPRPVAEWCCRPCICGGNFGIPCMCSPMYILLSLLLPATRVSVGGACRCTRKSSPSFDFYNSISLNH